MVMLWRVAYFEGYANLRIEALNVVGREVGISIKDEPVVTCVKNSFNEKEGLYAAIVVSPRFRNLAPTLIEVLKVEPDMYAIRRATARGVKNVR